MTADTRKRNRIQLLVIFAIAALSFGGSYFLFFSARDGQLWGTVNNGEFVEPAMEASSLELVLADGQAFATEGVWWLWVVTSGPCEAACNDAITQLRQLQVLLAKDAIRVRRGLVTPVVDPRITTFQAEFPKLEYLTGDAVVLLEPGVYIVDPRGFLVLRYTYEQAGKPVLQDLKRLLKVSQIG
jgi:cytochrome oxidase Cu insertion factor (SCO1/SenC/PrrC family)